MKRVFLGRKYVVLESNAAFYVGKSESDLMRLNPGRYVVGTEGLDSLVVDDAVEVNQTDLNIAFLASLDGLPVNVSNDVLGVRDKLVNTWRDVSYAGTHVGGSSNSTSAIKLLQKLFRLISGAAESSEVNLSATINVIETYGTRFDVPESSMWYYLLVTECDLTVMTYSGNLVECVDEVKRVVLKIQYLSASLRTIFVYFGSRLVLSGALNVDNDLTSSIQNIDTASTLSLDFVGKINS